MWANTSVNVVWPEGKVMEAGRRLVGQGFGGCVAEAMSLARSSERDKKWD